RDLQQNGFFFVLQVTYRSVQTWEPKSFLNSSKAGGVVYNYTALSIESAYPVLHALGQVQGSVMTASRQDEIKTPEMTPWGAPLVWGDSPNSAWRRAKFGQQGIQTGLFVLVVGTYTRFIKRFLTSAETHFLPGKMVTYYILTDSPGSLEPLIELGPERQMKVLPVAELPGWDRLSYRRMPLLADAIKDPIGSEVDYIFCADVDQEFVAPVEEEILGDLVATLHPELYGMQRSVYPYEDDEGSFAFVEEEEGEYYYTSELYGGLVSEMYKLARACSVLLFQDQANGVTARGLEESYLNRYLIDHRPTCVLSPEYSWWDSQMVFFSLPTNPVLRARLPRGVKTEESR
uniref:Globoside alpha-1,3-N-acetylgalactosaminyltransferase 1-like n=1 Tax=Gouania willdenowi TaxID=441366 RepID=A0A8C5I3P9_GOUWI